MQEKLINGVNFVHETYGPYRSVEELWDGEIWAVLFIVW